MEKLLYKPYEKEHMRMAMLKHEATFKEQVYELHRLYQIQKMMMRNMSDQIRKMDRTITAVDHSQIDDGASALEAMDESEIELTLGPTSYRNRRRRSARKPEITDSGDQSLSSSSTGSSQMNGNKCKRRNSYETTTTRLAETVSYAVEEERKLNHPPWLFQVLSL